MNVWKREMCVCVCVCERERERETERNRMPVFVIVGLRKKNCENFL
jgi:hypothetical protein